MRLRIDRPRFRAPGLVLAVCTIAYFSVGVSVSDRKSAVAAGCETRPPVPGSNAHPSQRWADRKAMTRSRRFVESITTSLLFSTTADETGDWSSDRSRGPRRSFAIGDRPMVFNTLPRFGVDLNDFVLVLDIDERVAGVIDRREFERAANFQIRWRKCLAVADGD